MGSCYKMGSLLLRLVYGVSERANSFSKSSGSSDNSKGVELSRMIFKRILRIHRLNLMNDVHLKSLDDAVIGRSDSMSVVAVHSLKIIQFKCHELTNITFA